MKSFRWILFLYNSWSCENNSLNCSFSMEIYPVLGFYRYQQFLLQIKDYDFFLCFWMDFQSPLTCLPLKVNKSCLITHKSQTMWCWNVAAGGISVSPAGAVIAGAPGTGSSEFSPALAPSGKTGSSSTIAISMQLIIVALGAAFYYNFWAWILMWIYETFGWCFNFVWFMFRFDFHLCFVIGYKYNLLIYGLLFFWYLMVYWYYYHYSLLMILLILLSPTYAYCRFFFSHLTSTAGCCYLCLISRIILIFLMFLRFSKILAPFHICKVIKNNTIYCIILNLWLIFSL